MRQHVTLKHALHLVAGAQPLASTWRLSQFSATSANVSGFTGGGSKAGSPALIRLMASRALSRAVLDREHVGGAERGPDLLAGVARDGGETQGPCGGTRT